jgi:hypothetical protein
VKDAPSIVPDPFANLITLIEEYESESDEWARELSLQQLRTEERAIAVRLPHLERFAHFAVEGALFVRRQSDSARRNNGRNLTRNIRLAIECVRRRRDPAYDGFSDSNLMAHVGDQMGGIGRSSAIECIKSVLSHHMVVAKIRESGERRNPDRSRSIFDDSKRPLNNDRRIDSDA